MPTRESLSGGGVRGVPLTFLLRAESATGDAPSSHSVGEWATGHQTRRIGTNAHVDVQPNRCNAGWGFYGVHIHASRK